MKVSESTENISSASRSISALSLLSFSSSFTLSSYSSLFFSRDSISFVFSLISLSRSLVYETSSLYFFWSSSLPNFAVPESIFCLSLSLLTFFARSANSVTLIISRLVREGISRPLTSVIRESGSMSCLFMRRERMLR